MLTPLHRLAFGFVLALGLPAVANGAAAEPKAVLMLVPEAYTVTEGDPLMVKLVLKNTGTVRVGMARAFTAGWCGMEFEAAQPGSDKFVRVRAVGQGVMCGLSRGRWIEPNDSLVAYEHLFAGRLPEPGAVFSHPGRWQVRASTFASTWVVSAPVSITVLARGKVSAKALDADFDSHLVDYRSFSTFEPNVLQDTVEALRGSNAGEILAQGLLLHRLQSAGPARERNLVLDELRTYRARLSDPAKEFLDLAIARVHLKRKEYREAQAIADTVRENSSHRASILATLAGRNP